MTQDQQQHLASLKSIIDTRISAKYKKGVKEHGGNLWDLSSAELLEEAINEAVDQLTYLLTLKEKLC